MYDILRLPYIMPNRGSGTEDATAAKPGIKEIYNQGGLPGLGAAARSGVKTRSLPANGVRMPGTTGGNPGWIDKELDALDCEFTAGGPKEPYAHFEMLREAQKEWWAAEAVTTFTQTSIRFIPSLPDTRYLMATLTRPLDALGGVRAVRFVHCAPCRA